MVAVAMVEVAGRTLAKVRRKRSVQEMERGPVRALERELARGKAEVEATERRRSSAPGKVERKKLVGLV